ncbi:MAG: ATP-binding cassette domain-containing protein [Gammaproteobacteria bacterium]
MIKLSNVSKAYDASSRAVVNNVTLEIGAGEILVIVGSSGCGKTTLLKMINRLIEPTSGVITVNNQDTQTLDPVLLRRSIGYVFQQVGLFPHMTIGENVSIVPRLCGIERLECERRAAQLLEFVNLNPHDFAERLPQELSGGQQQRVGVARALANEPACLLMDEPFGALDPVTRDALQADLLRLNAELHKTIVFVTHDITEAMRLADRIAVMYAGELQQVGTSQELLEQPATDFVRELFAVSKEQLKEVSEQLV